MALREEKKGVRTRRLPSHQWSREERDTVDGCDLVTIEDVTDPVGEDVVVLGEGDLLSNDKEDLDVSDAAEYDALGDGCAATELGYGEATVNEDLCEGDGNVAVML